MFKILFQFFLILNLFYITAFAWGNSCDVRDKFWDNTTFSNGNPTKPWVAWQTDKNKPCFYKCNNGYSWPNCKNLTEENACFKILTEKIKTTSFPSSWGKFLDAKWQTINLAAWVLKDENSQSKVALWTYDFFYDKLFLIQNKQIGKMERIYKKSTQRNIIDQMYLLLKEI